MLDKIPGDGLDRRQPVRHLLAELHILGLHAARDIDCQQQVASTDRQVNRGADELRPRRGNDQQHPGERGQQQTPA